MIKIQGHRGFPDLYPENTMIAFQKTYESGASGIEMDVRNTSDNQLVILHDETIDRTSNGSGKVTQMTLAELKTYDFGSWFDSAYTGTTIPTLDEVIAEYKDKDISLVLHCYPNSTEMLYAIVDKVANADILDKTIFFAEMSFINAIKNRNNGAITMNSGQPNINNYQTILDNAVQHGHDIVSINANESLTNLQTMVANIKQQGKLVNASYLQTNYTQGLDTHISLGTDYILVNNPLVAQQYVDSLNPTEPDPPTEPAQQCFKSGKYIKTDFGIVKADTYVKESFGVVKTDSFVASK